MYIQTEIKPRTEVWENSRNTTLNMQKGVCKDEEKDFKVCEKAFSGLPKKTSISLKWMNTRLPPVQK